MQISTYTINAFAKTPGGGNPAGVVVHADNLSVNQMKKIAAFLRLSETAFVMKSNVADFEIRFFTPADEVDLCGHATIGAFSVLRDLRIIKPGFYSQQTKAGLLSVEVRPDGMVMMNQTTPDFGGFIGIEEIADSLNIPADILCAECPIQIVSTGLRDILVPVRTLDGLNAIRPDFHKVSAISKRFHAVGFHLFTMESLYHSTAHCRNLAPLYGIPEESATGTASGALACYLFRHRAVLERQYGRSRDFDDGGLVFEQGYSMGRPSEIRASLRIEGDEILEVRVGGTAMDLQKVEMDV